MIYYALLGVAAVFCAYIQWGDDIPVPYINKDENKKEAKYEYNVQKQGKWDDVHTFSFCEHHIMLMRLTISISLDYKNIKTDEDGSYVKVIGLSKIPRICELVSKRLQLQERIATDIKYIVEKLLGVPVLVHIEGKHGCVSARGAKKDILFTTDI